MSTTRTKWRQGRKAFHRGVFVMCESMMRDDDLPKQDAHTHRILKARAHAWNFFSAFLRASHITQNLTMIE
jgi:hypothetical protein